MSIKTEELNHHVIKHLARIDLSREITTNVTDKLYTKYSLRNSRLSAEVNERVNCFIRVLSATEVSFHQPDAITGELKDKIYHHVLSSIVQEFDGYQI